jgi:hypothetical protein
MVRIKVEYDKYNRTFKLVDSEFGSVLDDGAHYELLGPVMLEGIGEAEGACVVVNIAPLGANLPATLLL